jgi:hypothetical protein
MSTPPYNPGVQLKVGLPFEMSMVSGPSSPARDRKKSAHWTDNDTESLVNVLLRYKDSGRTPDNGFRPEVWKEASLVLERSTFIGGPKTPEACKSRWQRVCLHCHRVMKLTSRYNVIFGQRKKLRKCLDFVGIGRKAG